MTIISQHDAGGGQKKPAQQTPAPYEIILEDILAPWVIGRRLIRKGGTIVVEIAKADDSGFWVYRLTKSMTRAQRSTPRNQGKIPKAFRLFPVVAITEWAYYERRPQAGALAGAT